ncbi:MAG TPA: potassium transporter Kup [Pyrinomonadaceae bacterium]|jgi:KUP system potassium uptake protein|nr:potassium transporter Kup [Pyrinomonadaceae bacterium]
MAATASAEIHATLTDAHGHPHTATPSGRYLALLSLTALGIVYGDIGTSPLYAMRECFHGPHAIQPTPENVFGVMSLIFWALILIISIKYCVFVLRADNRGEGGILALTALATPIKVVSRSERKWIVVIGIFGAALLYGDGIITPAISVLGAVEGLNVATPLFAPYVVPATVVIIVGLFFIQSRGTAKVGRLFGPVMLVWFAVIAALGVAQSVRRPSVFGAFNPAHGLDFFMRNGWHGFLVLGTVFLVVTGGEALYADMGHFGKRPIRVVWYSIVLPALMLNYLGQGALLIENPAAAENPFYRLAPAWALYPLIALATCAAIIASQALISGAYSLTMQAIQLGFIPRFKIEHTSSTEMGQIYIPALNWALMAGCIAIVVGFGSSSNLAAAYGVAVTATMVITTILLAVVERRKWGWGLLPVGALTGFFLVIDLAFFGANVIKIPHGGWFPLVVGACIFVVMTTWKKGRRILASRMLSLAVPVEDFLRDIEQHPPVRVPGTAVFMTGTGTGTPTALEHNLEHNKVLHTRVILLTVKTRQTPYVEPGGRVKVEPLGQEFYRLTINYGFMEDPNIPAVMAELKAPGLDFDPANTTFFLGRETVIAGRHPGMMLWREKLFALLSRNASSATAYFCLPPDRVVEMGSQVEI